MTSLLSDNLLNVFNKTNYDGDEEKIVEDSMDYIRNVDQEIINLREQLTNLFVDVMTSPENVHKKIEEEKEKLKTMLNNFNGIYDKLINTNENAINVQTICERNLVALKAEQNASESRHNKAQKILVERERDHEAAVTEHDRNVKALKFDDRFILCGKIVVVIIIVGFLHIIVKIYFPKFYIPVLTEILGLFSIFFGCCIPCWGLCIMLSCCAHREQRELRYTKKVTYKNLQKIDEMTKRLKTKYETAAENLNRVTNTFENQSNKIKIFAELKKILCNIQIYLRKFQTPLDEAGNLFCMQVCPPVHLPKLAEKERQRFVKKIIKIFNEIQSIYNQYESMKLLFKSLF